MRLRQLLVVTATTMLAVFVVPGAAQGHSEVLLTVNHDGRGNISVDVNWVDGHPVTGALAASMMAFPDSGPPVGPVALLRLPNQPTVVHEDALTAGHWRVVVDTAVPAIGHCEAQFQIGTGSTPSSTRCGDPKPTTGSTLAAPTGEHRGGTWTAKAVGASITLAACVLGAVAVGRRRRRTVQQARRHG